MNLSIGATIKNLRVKHKVTQDALATFLGISPQAISRWESENGYPDIELLPSIAGFFSVTADELLGMNRTDKEKRRDEIYLEIKRQSEAGDADENSIAEARKYTAEFPNDARIQMHLADYICRVHEWSEKPDTNALCEAEKLYVTLAETAEDDEFRYEVLESLASLYAVGFKDTIKTERTLLRLPTMKYCREQVGSAVSEMTGTELWRRQDYIEKLTDSLGTTLTGYIIDGIPNDSDRWDDKIAMLEQVLALYKLVFGEEMLFYNCRAASVYRVIATYKIAQGKNDETLECLEKMTLHLIKESKVNSGDKFTSDFMNEIAYPDKIEPFGDFDALTVHNDAWYVLKGKLVQSRYDPIRDTPRFKAIIGELEAVAK